MSNAKIVHITVFAYGFIKPLSQVFKTTSVSSGGMNAAIATITGAEKYDTAPTRIACTAKQPTISEIAVNAAIVFRFTTLLSHPKDYFVYKEVVLDKWLGIGDSNKRLNQPTCQK